jgi:substrate-binding family protein
VASGILALALVIALVGIVVAVNRGGDEGTKVAIGESPSGAPSGEPSVLPSGLETPTFGPTPGATLSPGATPSVGASVPGVTPSVRPGAGPPPTRCSPRQPRAANRQPETGITNKTISVGQIVSDSANLPAQLKPNYEGLTAYFRKINDAGGVCGRKLQITYRNDQGSGTQHDDDYTSLAQSVFAFVANSSIGESIGSRTYADQPPFDPTVRDNRTGEFVPDVGGLAYAYNRGQSRWHAGAVGSISPVLTGGGAYRGMLNIVRSEGRPCRKMGVVYLIEPTFASEDQARLSQPALESSWGGNLGRGNTRLYQASLSQPAEVYRGLVENMIRDGMNCMGTFMDLGSNVNLVIGAAQAGVWPPGRCTRADKTQCFNMVYMPFAGYDPKFIRDVESRAKGASLKVLSFLPHIPMNETGDPALRRYLADLRACKGDKRYSQCSAAEPSTFSMIGYVSGIMFVDAVRACGAAPTRRCVMTYLRGLRNFTGGGLLGRISPFKCTRANDNARGNRSLGTYCWKWIFTDTITVRVESTKADLSSFRRIRPSSGYAPDTLRVARGTPA